VIVRIWQGWLLHCIFTYANQRIQDKLSRKKADELFRKILDCCYDEKTHESNWETVKNLGNLSNDGGLEESELEKSFIYALERFAHNDSQQGGTHHWAFKRDTSAFREQYTLTFDDGLHKIIYNIIPQYVLDSSKGVAYHTEPDFLIQPVGMSENRGHGWVEVNFYHLKSIAIYMDGYRYHASGKHNVFAKDFQKRQSIDASTRYTSFTLTWKDMDIFAAEDHRDDTIIDRHNNKILQQLGPNAWITKRNSMERLLHYLGNLWQDKKLKDSLTIYIIGLQANLAPPYTLFKAAPWASIDIKVDMQKRQLVSDLKVDDDYHPEDGLPMDMWQDFWRAYNLTSLYRGLDVVQQTPTQTNEWERLLASLMMIFTTSFFNCLNKALPSTTMQVWPSRTAKVRKSARASLFLKSCISSFSPTTKMRQRKLAIRFSSLRPLTLTTFNAHRYETVSRRVLLGCLPEHAQQSTK
jgi:hypothetical protein